MRRQNICTIIFKDALEIIGIVYKAGLVQIQQPTNHFPCLVYAEKKTAGFMTAKQMVYVLTAINISCRPDIA